jgi:LysW-gamma-L-lysine/LysW-L-ornithine aminotransferase
VSAPTTADLLAREKAHDSGVVPKRPFSIVRGQGARLWDAEGREFLDFGATHGAMNVGHAHPRVVEAIERQARTLGFVAATYANDARAAYVEALCRTAPGLERAFLCSTGTEAIEAALKFARGHTKRPGLVAAKGAFHGRTMGALALTHKEDYRAPFAPLLPGAQHVPYGDAEALKGAVTRETAAVVLEPIQGEGGVHVAPPGYLRAALDIAHDAGALLVLDEVQTGFGRTGSMWAHQREGVTPDILAFAKSAAGGLPLGGVLLRPEVCTLSSMSHGSTFGGNPLVCAAGLAVLQVLQEERLAERAAALGPRFMDHLREAAGEKAREVRGAGLMLGLDLRVRAQPVLQALAAQGVLALAAGSTVVRYLPPLTIAQAELGVAVAATAKALEAGA